MAAQDADRERVEGAEPGHALDHAADEAADAGLHLARRLVGEGDGEDLVRAGAAGVQQVGDAGGQRPGLAGAGAGEHQHRAVERLDGGALGGVEVVEVGRRPRGGGARRQRALRGLEGFCLVVDPACSSAAKVIARARGKGSLRSPSVPAAIGSSAVGGAGVRESGRPAANAHASHSRRASAGRMASRRIATIADGLRHLAEQGNADEFAFETAGGGRARARLGVWAGARPRRLGRRRRAGAATGSGWRGCPTTCWRTSG